MMKKPLVFAAILMGTGIAQAQAVTYAIDPSHTFVNFEVLHRGTSTVRGRFEKKEGSVSFDRAGKTGKAEITIDMKSVSTGVAALDKHLASADFFDVERHPTAKFVSDKFSFGGDRVAEVSGTLTLRGKSQPIALKASNFNCYDSPMLKREVCGGDFETMMVRSTYGIMYGLPGTPDNVRILIQIEAIKQ